MTADLLSAAVEACPTDSHLSWPNALVLAVLALATAWVLVTVIKN